MEKRIREIIPEDAQITDIYFEDETGEVTIEAIAPGLVIGKHGSVLNEIKKEVGWAPKVVRAPPIPSKTVSDIRNYLRTDLRSNARTSCKKVGRRLARPADRGRVLDSHDRTGRLPRGRPYRHPAVHQGEQGADRLRRRPLGQGGRHPYFNAPEIQPLDNLDAIVITHAHLDHCGLLPALYKYGYDGPVYCTAPTRDLMSLLQLDYIKVSFGEGKKAPYDSSHVREMVEALHPAEVRRDHGHRTGHPADVPERRSHPRLGGLPLPHRRRAVQHRLHRAT